MSPRPAVSVLICTYQRLRLVRRAAASALAQDVADLEVVVVDDGSTDGTAAWGRAAAAAEPRLRYERLPRNGGPVAARNRGLALARAPLVAFLDSDDVWEPGHLRALLPAFRDASVSGAFSNYDVVDARGRVLERAAFKPKKVVQPKFRELTGYGCVPLTSAFVGRLRALRRAGGFDPAFRRFYDDADLFYNLAKTSGAASLRFVDRRTVRYLRHRAQLSSLHPYTTTQAYVERALGRWRRLSALDRDFFFDWLHFRRKHLDGAA